MGLHEGNWPAVGHRRQGPVAPERSLRIKAFYSLLPYFSHLARRRRMRKFVQLMNIKPGIRVLDLGGSPRIWDNVEIPLDITMLNLPGAIPSAELDAIRVPGSNTHCFRHIEGDACHVTEFPDHSFDLIFSNSVIEHVGPEHKQEEFAREVLRLGKSYWVQTPSPWFPIEAHSGLPFYWFYPERFRAWLLRKSQKTLPAWWTDYIATTRVLSRRRVATLFPNARIRVEFLFGFPKSYVAYSSVTDPR